MPDLLIIAFGLLWLAGSLLVGAMAQLQGRSLVGWTLGALVVSPAVALLALMALTAWGARSGPHREGMR